MSGAAAAAAAHAAEPSPAMPAGLLLPTRTTGARHRTRGRSRRSLDHDANERRSKLPRVRADVADDQICTNGATRAWHAAHAAVVIGEPTSNPRSGRRRAVSRHPL